MSGCYEPNFKLREAQRLFEDQLVGPESIANFGGQYGSKTFQLESRHMTMSFTQFVWACVMYGVATVTAADIAKVIGQCSLDCRHAVDQ